MEAGDVLIVLQMKEHEKFVRETDNLFIKHSVNLTEALCGFNFVVKHLDGRNLLIKSAPGEIIEPGETFFPVFIVNLLIFFMQYFWIWGCIRGIVGEGMPKHKHPELKGNLYIKFAVDFPEPHFATDDMLKVSSKVKYLPIIGLGDLKIT